MSYIYGEIEVVVISWAGSGKNVVGSTEFRLVVTSNTVFIETYVSKTK